MIGEDDDFGIVLRNGIKIQSGIGGEALHKVPVTFIGLQGVWADRIGLTQIELQLMTAEAVTLKYSLFNQKSYRIGAARLPGCWP